MSDDNNTFSLAQLKAMMRKMDGLVSDDVIAVTALCPMGKAFEFVDERGKVIAIHPAMMVEVKKRALPTTPDNPIMAGALSLLGLPVIYADIDDAAAWRVRQRIKRSLQAAADVQAWWESWK